MKKIIVTVMVLAVLGWAAPGWTQGGTGIGEAYITMKQQAAKPSSPGSTYNRLYFKSDGKLYHVNSSGTETEAGVAFAGTESTTGSAGSLKSPDSTGVTQISGPGAGQTRKLTIPDADTTLGTAASATLGTGAGQVPVTGDYVPVPAASIDDGQVLIKDGTGTTGKFKAGGVLVEIKSVIDGSAHVHLTAAQMAIGTGCHVTNFGQSGAVDLLLPAAADSLECLFTVGDAEAAHYGVTSNTGDDIYLIAAAGTVSQCGDQTSVVLDAAQVGQSFACWTFKTAANAYDWMCKAIAIGTSTFACHAAISAP